MLERKAKKGSVKAQVLIGFSYYSGRMVNQDTQKAIYWFNKAAEGGNSEAMYLLAGIYFEGKVIAKDYTQGVLWIKKAAENGYPPAQLTLGNMYAEGKFIEKDSLQSVKWFLASAEGGNTEAQKITAGIYHLYPEYDNKIAYAWYMTAAFCGDTYSKQTGELLYSTLSDEDKITASELASLYISKYAVKQQYK